MDDKLKAAGFYIDATSCQLESTCDVHIAAVSLESAGSIVCFEVSKMARYAASLIVLGTFIFRPPGGH